MSQLGITTTILATGLAESVRKDEAHDPASFDLSAGLFGTNLTSWLRTVAGDFVRLAKTDVDDEDGRDQQAYYYRQLSACARAQGFDGLASALMEIDALRRRTAAAELAVQRVVAPSNRMHVLAKLVQDGGVSVEEARAGLHRAVSRMNNNGGSDKA